MSTKQTMQERIEDCLQQAFAPQHLQVRNDSDKHVGHAGHDGSGMSHFHVIVVDETFSSMSRIDRYRCVHEVLQPLIDQGIHALSLKIVSPSEYVEK